MARIRPCRDDEREAIGAIVNASRCATSTLIRHAYVAPAGRRLGVGGLAKPPLEQACGGR